MAVYETVISAFLSGVISFLAAILVMEYRFQRKEEISKTNQIEAWEEEYREKLMTLEQKLRIFSKSYDVDPLEFAERLESCSNDIYVLYGRMPESLKEKQSGRMKELADSLHTAANYLTTLEGDEPIGNLIELLEQFRAFGEGNTMSDDDFDDIVEALQAYKQFSENVPGDEQDVIEGYMRNSIPNHTIAYIKYVDEEFGLLEIDDVPPLDEKLPWMEE